MNNAPCKGCEKREIGCHGSCEAYLSFKKEREELSKQKLRKQDLYYVKDKSWMYNMKRTHRKKKY